MQHFFQNIQGWFSFPGLYKAVINRFPDGSHFVEIGTWKGKSAAFMAVELINQNKNIKFDCVDTWEGSEEHRRKYGKWIVFNQQLAGLYEHFLKNIEPVNHIINPIRKASLDAVRLYEDNSLDFIFIDASHDYENVLKDITAWYPKIKHKTGIISGHDIGFPSVRRAVEEFFNAKNLIIQESEDCWIVGDERVGLKSPPRSSAAPRRQLPLVNWSADGIDLTP